MKKLLIITGSFGNGHIQVTNSLVEELKNNYPDIEVIESDVYLEAHPNITPILKKLYLTSFTYFRDIYGLVYHSGSKYPEISTYRYYSLKYLVNLVEDERPDLILLTFPVPAMAVLTKDFKINRPVATVITDYSMHKSWLTPSSQRYYVATEELKQQLVDLDCDESIVKVTGIPIKAKFEEETDRKQWLEKFNLDSNKKTILMVAGAFGVLKNFDKMIAKILEEDLNGQIVVVCGKNEELKSDLEEKFGENKEVCILGYTTDMKEWMSVATVLITKPGGITVTESLASKVPLILYKPTPGQEKENAIYFNEKNMALIAENTEELLDRLIYLLNNENKLLEIKHAMEKNYKPSSAKNICQDLEELLNNNDYPSEIYDNTPIISKLMI